MPDAVQTIRELVTGFNQIQQQMGLTPLSANATGFQPPATPPVSPIALKHPSETASEAAQQINQQVQVATRTFQAQNQFAMEFGQRMKSIQAQYVPVQYAQTMARTTGQDAFGMEGPLGDLPSPIYQTPAQMGIYRPQLPRPGMYATPGTQGAGFNAPVPAPFIPQPYMPLWTGGPYLGNMMPQWFGGQAPMGRFGDTYEREMMQREYMGNRAFAQAMAVTPTAFTTLPGAGLGAAGGAAIGRGLGGTRGALIGAGLGFVGGGIAGQPLFENLGFGRMGEAVVEPMVRTRAYGNQLEDISRQFVTTGPDLHAIGRGLSQRAAIGTAEQMQRMVENAEVGEFNMRDMMRITGMAAQGGMLDMAQSGSQIAQQVKNVARALQNFMHIAEEPDVQRAMQMMSTMRATGMSLQETQIAARNAKEFARMAGTTTQGIMETAGAQGALVFQQQGMTGAAGMTAGIGAAAMARQAIAAGAFNPAQLALAGGQQGLTQTLTEASAANLNVRFPMMAALSRNEQGQLTIDQGRLHQLMSGQVGLSEQAAMASANIQRLAEQGGTSPERVISEISTRQQELQDEMGRRLGPLGQHQMLLRQALNIQQELGGNVNLASALRHASGGTLTQNQATAMARMYENQDTWRAMQQQVEVEIPRHRMEEAQRREAAMGEAGFTSRVLRDTGIRGWWDQPNRVTGTLSEGWRNMRRDVSEWWTGPKRTADEGYEYQTPDRLRITDAAVRRELRRGLGNLEIPEELRSREAERALEVRRGLRRSTEDNTLSARETVSSVADFAKEVGFMRLGGGMGWKGTALALGVGSVTPTIGTPETSYVNEALRARGGWGGVQSQWMPNYMNFVYHGGWLGDLTGRAEQQSWNRQELFETAQGVYRAGAMARRGVGATEEQARGMREQFREGYSKFAEEKGLDAGQAGDIEYELTQALTEELSKTGVQNNLTDVELRQIGARRLAQSKKMSYTSAMQLMQEQGDVLMPRVLRQVEATGGKTARGRVAELMTQKEGRGEYDLLKAAGQDAEKYAKDTRKLIQGDRFWNKVTDEQVKGIEETLIKTSTTDKTGDEALMRMAAALKERGSDDDRRRAKQIEDEVKGRIGADKTNEMMERVGREVSTGTKDFRQSWAVFGETMTNEGMTGERRVAEVQRARKRAAGSRSAQAIRAGAAIMAEREGGGETAEELFKRAMEGGNVELREKLFDLGERAGGKVQVGGKGAGSKGEREALAQSEQLGKMGLDVAKFNRAADSLLQASENFASGNRASNLRIAQGLQGGHR